MKTAKTVFVQKSNQLTPLPALGQGSKVEKTAVAREQPTGKQKLLRKSRNKWYSQQVAGAMLNVVKQHPHYNPKIKKGLYRCLGCCKRLKRIGNRVIAMPHSYITPSGYLKEIPAYCNARFCINCQHMRTAKRIDAYYEEIQLLTDKYFVVLSRPSIFAVFIKSEIEEQYKIIRKIKKRLTKRRIKLRGVRSLECTHNQETDSYHPHWHWLVSGKADAEALLEEWLIECPTAIRDKGNKIFAYDPGRNGERTLIELLKYETKLIVPLNNKKGKGINGQVLYNIYEAFYGKRAFQAMGIIAKKKVGDDKEFNDDDVNQGLESEIYEHLPDDGVEEVYEWAGTDFFSMETGAALTNYSPPENFNTS